MMLDVARLTEAADLACSAQREVEDTLADLRFRRGRAYPEEPTPRADPAIEAAAALVIRELSSAAQSLAIVADLAGGPYGVAVLFGKTEDR